VKENVKKAAEDFFSDKSHERKSLVHITRDGQCFDEWHDANEHSKTLGNLPEDRHIEEVKRSDVEVKEIKKGK
jgi:hypothetical protein